MVHYYLDKIDFTVFDLACKPFLPQQILSAADLVQLTSHLGLI